MKTIFKFICAGILLAGCDMNEEATETNNSHNEQVYQLVWSDEFDYTDLPDTTKWAYDTEGNAEGWGNNEAQYYTTADKDNAWVENGVLHIIALKENTDDKLFTSARLDSKVGWQYGKIEVRAKLPPARGSWSAIWMMPGGWTFKDGNWPDIGEIDIMEHVGYDLGVVHGSAHSKDYQWQKKTQKTNTVYIADAHQEFHTYMLDWSSEEMNMYVDDSLYFNYTNEGKGETKWPYNKPFYLILNLAVGGIWGGMQGIDEDAFPQTMEVDYVRVYQKNSIEIEN